MADQIVLAWTVSVAGTSLGTAAAATRLAAVALYQNAVTDPILGQFFGLTVDSDVTAQGVGVVTRTLTLNMNSTNAPEAPPPFPCRPRTSTPPVLPYRLRSARTLPGSFTATTGNAAVATSDSQIPSLTAGDVVQLLTQRGVFYTVLTVTSTVVTFTAPYTGTTGTGGAFKEVDAPVTRVAAFSSSNLDQWGVGGVVPGILGGPGAQTIEITYDDSAGNGPFTAQIDMTGRRPSPMTLAPGSVDVLEIQNITVQATGGFDNNVGQITLVEMSDAIPTFPPTTTNEEFLGALTDEAQALIATHLAYLPPSYLALAQQGAAAPVLAGDLLVSTGSVNVFTTEDLTGALNPGDTIEFAIQPGTIYTVAGISFSEERGLLTLTTPFTGLEPGLLNPQNTGTKVDRPVPAVKFPTIARVVVPSASAPPTNAQLSGPLAQFVNPATAVPPPNPPFPPASIPAPTFLSGLYTQTIQKALAGVPVTPATITFLP